METSETSAHPRCLEPVRDGWGWHSTGKTDLRILLAVWTTFMASLGILMSVIAVQVALKQDQSMRAPSFLICAGTIVVIVIALWLTVPRLLPWTQAVFVVEGGHPHVLLLRGRRRKVVALDDVIRIAVVHGGEVDGRPTDSRLEICSPGRSFVGWRGYEPAAADELYRLLPPTIDVCTRFG